MDEVNPGDEANPGSLFVIRGLTLGGARFRPSDWAERLAGAFSVIDPNNRMNYSPYVQPGTLDGVPCVIVLRSLKSHDPQAYRFLEQFARCNELVTQDTDSLPT